MATGSPWILKATHGGACVGVVVGGGRVGVPSRCVEGGGATPSLIPTRIGIRGGNPHHSPFSARKGEGEVGPEPGAALGANDPAPPSAKTLLLVAFPPMATGGHVFAD